MRRAASTPLSDLSVTTEGVFIPSDNYEIEGAISHLATRKPPVFRLRSITAKPKGTDAGQPTSNASSPKQSLETCSGLN